MRNFAILISVAAACGGGGSGGGAPITEDQARSICTPDCQREIDCGNTTDDLATCTQKCLDDMVGWARVDAVETIFDCRSALACGASDDGCVLEVQPLAIHQQWEDKCRVQLATCVSTPADLEGLCEVSPDPANDNIGFFRFVAPAIMTELIACLDGADCTARMTCVTDTLAAHGIDF